MTALVIYSRAHYGVVLYIRLGKNQSPLPLVSFTFAAPNFDFNDLKIH